MTDCINREIELRKDYLKNEPVDSVYFGGGTPSWIGTAYIQSILNTLHENFTISPLAEITLEANPDDVQPEMLATLRNSGINRLSLGVQSFFNAHLQWMHRAHNAEDAHLSIRQIQQAGFSNYSVDLIYGLPGLTDDQWRQNLEVLLGENVPHISCYALTVEPKTELFHTLKKNKIPPLDEEQSERQYHITHRILTENGYDHYEISNFAKPGFRAVHNSAYWEGKHYLGIGPSAHSFNGASRQWNASNNALYMHGIGQGVIPHAYELLSPVQQANEMIMIALRQSSGLNLTGFQQKFGTAFYKALLKNIGRNTSAFETDTGDNLVIRECNRFISDTIISDLFLEE